MFISPPVAATVQEYVVKPGDSLSAISLRLFGNADEWPWLYDENLTVVGSDPNLILPGQKLIPKRGKHAAYGTAVTVWTTQPYTPKHASDEIESAVPIASAVNNARVSVSGLGSFQACVISRESGGNSQVMNSTDHYGLYQFSYSTWVAYGGSGADFGHASVAEQNRIFANAMSQPNGASNWAPYDGC